MFCPEKYSAEASSSVPTVVALDAPMYSIPGLFPSKILLPGSKMIRSTAFFGWPSLTGPAD